MIYSKLHKLPYEKFKDCVCDNDLTALVIEGEHTAQELAEVWADLMVEYNQSLGNENDEEYFAKYRDYLELKRRQEYVHFYVKVLSRVYFPEFAQKLLQLVRWSVKLDPSDQEGYYSILDRCLLRANSLELDLAEMELLNVQTQRSAQGEDSEPPSRESFVRIEVNLESFEQRNIDWDKKSALYFSELIKRFRVHLNNKK